jgi:hypothetical protein
MGRLREQNQMKVTIVPVQQRLSPMIGRHGVRKMWLEGAVTLVLAVLLTGCAGLSSAPDPAPRASTAKVLPVIALAPAQLPDYWLLQDEDTPESPATAGRSLQLGCVAINFGIDVEGRSFGGQIRKSWPQGKFVEYALAEVPTWQFEPAPGNPLRQPVRTERVLVLQSVDGKVMPVLAEHIARYCQ